MNRIVKYIFLATLLISLSCDEKGWFVKCVECSDSEPLTVTLNIKLTSSEKYNAYPVEVNLYQGDIEDSILISTASYIGSTANFVVSLNRKYTVTATYKHISGNTYTAVDSATPRVKYETEMCEEPCYFLYDKQLDLRLKYY